MTAATIDKYLFVKSTQEEKFAITVSDGETITSRKFNTIDGVQMTFNEDMGSLAVVPGIAISSGVMTFHCTGVSDKKVFLTVSGDLGN